MIRLAAVPAGQIAREAPAEAEAALVAQAAPEEPAVPEEPAGREEAFPAEDTPVEAALHAEAARDADSLYCNVGITYIKKQLQKTYEPYSVLCS